MMARALTYTLEGELPAGLSFDGAARTISGTPPTDATAEGYALTYRVGLGRFRVRRRSLRYAEGYALTYRVVDVDGDAVELSFTIAVNGGMLLKGIR
jgi:hypothetical protein